MNSYNDKTYKEIRRYGKVEEELVNLEDLNIMVGKPHNTDKETIVRIDTEQCMVHRDGFIIKQKEIGSSVNAEESGKSSEISSI
jgi:hypothetical protein